MKTNTDLFEKTPVPKAVATMAVPTMISMLVVVIYNMADTFFIGQTKDPLQVAAVSLATPVFMIFMALGHLFGIGGSSAISRALGERHKDRACHISSSPGFIRRTLRIWEAVVGLFLSFIQSLAMLPLFSKMDKRGKVLNAAFSVAGAYVVGGQMTLVASLIPGNWVIAYMISKVLSGGLAVVLAVICLRRSKMITE